MPEAKQPRSVVVLSWCLILGAAVSSVSLFVRDHELSAASSESQALFGISFIGAVVSFAAGYLMLIGNDRGRVLYFVMTPALILAITLAVIDATDVAVSTIAVVIGALSLIFYSVFVRLLTRKEANVYFGGEWGSGSR